MTESKRSELGNRIGARGSKKRAEWISRWGHWHEDFQINPTVDTAVDLLTFTKPPAFVVDELREFLINPPKKLRGRPKKRQQHYDRVAFLVINQPTSCGRVNIVISVL